MADRTEWPVDVRMAAGRLVAYGPMGLTAREVAALLADPDELASAGYTADQLPTDAPEHHTGPTGMERMGGHTRAGSLSANQPMAGRTPEFDGATYRHHPDYARLGDQARRVWAAMDGGAWHTLAELAAATGDPEASVSARLRDFRKEQWGGHTVERVRADPSGGTHVYRLIPAPPEGSA